MEPGRHFLGSVSPLLSSLRCGGMAPEDAKFNRIIFRIEDVLVNEGALATLC